MNFSYLAIKLLNFKPVEKKLPKLEPWVSHSFGIKLVSRKKLSKVLASPQTHFWWSASVSKCRCVYEISQYFFTDLKLYPWSNQMANNLILAISFGFKLNSNLKGIKLLWNYFLIIFFLWLSDRPTQPFEWRAMGNETFHWDGLMKILKTPFKKYV